MRGKLQNICFALLVGLFCLLLIHLFLLRFKAGDIYPAYSSLRSDPLGTKALAESLDRLDAVSVTRNYHRLDRLAAPGNTTLFFLGIPSGRTHVISQEEYDQIHSLLKAGARLVIALTPVGLNAFDNECTQSDSSKPDPLKSDPPETDSDQTGDQSTADSDADRPSRVDLYEKWGLKINLYKDGKGRIQALSAGGIPGISERVSWPLALWFAPDAQGWQTIYGVEDRPVIIERTFGRGRVVLVADSYIFSNESLKNDKNSRLLAWLSQGRPRVVFDEFHFGIQVRPGISTLVKQYNLYGPILFIVLVVVLVIWKRASGLVPPDEQKELMAMMETQDASRSKLSNMSGLTSLLKQHIPTSRLMDECKTAWKQAFVKDNQASASYARLFEKATSHKKQKPVDEYIRICRILSKGKK